MATPHVTKAKAFAKAVVAGKKLAGKYLRLACQRFLDDLARDDIEFRPEAGERACQFLEKFSHVKGRWARDASLIVLEPWQCFVVVAIFGFFRLDGSRRVVEVYLRVARKNGKSMLAAAIGLYMFVEDGEYGAEVYSGATSEKQAWEVFGPARQMALRHPNFRQHFSVEVNAKNMNRPEDNSKFEPVIGNPGDGPSPSCAIIDEFHEHTSWALYNTMDTGMAARENPMKLITTTAGDDIASPCFEKDDECRKILEGVYKDDSIFAVIFAADDDDDWQSVTAMKKANPNLGISVSKAYLERQLDKAIRSPAAQAAYKTKNLDLWVSSGSAFLNSLLWAKCGSARLNVADFQGWRCIFGLDLASRIDFVALVKLFFRVDEAGLLRYAVFPRFFLPENRLEDDKTGQYAKWHAEGHLELHEDDEIDFAKLRAAILDEARTYTPMEIAFDPWRAIGIEQELSAEGLVMVKIPQTIAHMTSAMDELEASIGQKKDSEPRLVHTNNPIMNWMAGNLVAKEDTNGNKKPRREIAKNKIDGMVATLNAMNRALAQPNDGLADWLSSIA